MCYFVTIDGREFEVKIGLDGVCVDGQELQVSLESSGATTAHSLLVGSQAHKILADRGANGEWSLHLDGLLLKAEVIDGRTRAIRDMSHATVVQGPEPVVAPMPGMVVKVEVKEGDRVESGQSVIIVEAMKMMNQIESDIDGIVERILVQSGDPVEYDQVLFLISPN